MNGAAFYTGTVRHRRFSPKPHAFTYQVSYASLDLDRLPELCAISPFLGLGRWNWASFDERDYLPAAPGAAPTSLRERLRRDAAAQGHVLPAGPVYLLTLLRYFGHSFNPVSYYSCHDEGGRLVLLCAEVTSTPWMERHTYWMALGAGDDARACSFDVAKELHVSPFLPMSCRYRWTFANQDDRLQVRMAVREGSTLVFDADLELVREEWSAAALHRSLLRFPWMSIKVVAAIHWEALRLWWKGVPVHTHPAPHPQSPPPGVP